ncbi:hypothetical protein PZL24_09920 [Staphylococcus epidermidis]|nr:hypothetical protein [Staphylococcus epidermidis]MDH9960001.1 hypothetical protein [Staphylococcus epidermidis]
MFNNLFDAWDSCYIHFNIKSYIKILITPSSLFKVIIFNFSYEVNEK